jgi:bifunctional DNase/RNase
MKEKKENEKKDGEAEFVPVEVAGVYFAGNPLMGGSPVVFLAIGEKWLPVFIGIGEAISIDMALRGETPPRPMTHDLMIAAITTLGGTMEKAVVDRLDDQVFYAKLYLKDPKGDIAIDARPSDCIALAIRAKAPVLIDKTMFEESAVDRTEIKQGDEGTDEFIRMMGKYKDKYKP